MLLFLNPWLAGQAKVITLLSTIHLERLLDFQVVRVQQTWSRESAHPTRWCRMRQRLWTTRSWIFVTCNVSPISSRAFFLLDVFSWSQGKDFQEALQSSQRASELLGQPLMDEPRHKDPTLADGIFGRKRWCRCCLQKTSWGRERYAAYLR